MHQDPPVKQESATTSEGENEEDEDVEEEEEESPQTSPPCPPSQPLLIGSCSGFIETTVKIKQNDMLPGPKVCVWCVCVEGDDTHFSGNLCKLCIYFKTIFLF